MDDQTVFMHFSLGQTVHLYQKRANGTKGIIKKVFLGSGSIVINTRIEGLSVLVSEPSNDWEYGNDIILTGNKIKYREIQMSSEILEL